MARIFGAAAALALAVCPGVQAQAQTGSNDTSSWDSRWSTAACQGAFVGAACAELNAGFTLGTSGTDTYLWQAPAASGHGGCNPQGQPSGSSVGRTCGTATFRVFCSRAAVVNFVADGQAARLRGNDDSMWAFFDGLRSQYTYVTGWGLAPRWNWRQVIGQHAVFTTGTHTIALAEREDGTRVRRIAFSTGYPDCQFGVPPPMPNVTAETVRQQVLQLETDTNNRVSAVSTMMSALNSTLLSTAGALSAQMSTSLSTHASQIATDMSNHAAMATAAQQSLATAQQSMASVASSVSSAIAAVTTRLGTLGSVTSFSSGGSGGGALQQAPRVSTSGQDVTVAAGFGGTVRVQGGQCQADLCGLVGQVSTLTDALRTL